MIRSTLSDLVSILASGASLLLGFLCLINIQGVNRSGNRWLGVFISCIFFLYADDILTIAGINIERSAEAIIFLNSPAFIFSPAFFYSVSYYITPDRLWKIKDYLHLFALALINILVSFYLLNLNARGDNFVLALVSGNFGVLFCLQIF